MLYGALGGFGFPSRDILNKYTSPDGKYEAVFTRSNYHATVAYVYTMHIIEKGGDLTEDNIVAKYDSEASYGKWIGQRHFHLPNYSNNWYKRDEIYQTRMFYGDEIKISYGYD